MRVKKVYLAVFIGFNLALLVVECIQKYICLESESKQGFRRINPDQIGHKKPNISVSKIKH